MIIYIRYSNHNHVCDWPDDKEADKEYFKEHLLEFGKILEKGGCRGLRKEGNEGPFRKSILLDALSNLDLETCTTEFSGANGPVPKEIDPLRELFDEENKGNPYSKSKKAKNGWRKPSVLSDSIKYNLEKLQHLDKELYVALKEDIDELTAFHSWDHTFLQEQLSKEVDRYGNSW